MFGPATVVCAVVASAAAPETVLAACDVSTAGTSVCTGSDAGIAKMATGDLTVQFNSQTVTTSGVSLLTNLNAFDLSLIVNAAAGPNPIANVSGTGVTLVSNGGDVSVKTLSGSPVHGLTGGIFAESTAGSGNVDITAHDVTSDLGVAISGRSVNGDIDIAIKGQVSAGGDGIFAEILGTGFAHITSDGPITAGIMGVYAISNSGALDIQTNGTIDAGVVGVLSQIYGGSGAMSITANGDITAVNDGVQALSDATGAVSVGGSGDISGGDGYGIYVSGPVAETITIAGTGGTSSATLDGIKVYIGNPLSDGDISITRSGTVTAAMNGIDATAKKGDVVIEGIGKIVAGGVAINTAAVGDVLISTAKPVDGALGGVYAASATGSVNITVDDVKASNGHGVFASTAGEISVSNTGAIKAAETGITLQSSPGNPFDSRNTITNFGTVEGQIGIVTEQGAPIIANHGAIFGGAGTAIKFGGSANRLTLMPGSSIVGKVLATGADTLELGGKGSGIFNAGFGSGEQYQGFGTLEKTGNSTWILSSDASGLAGPTTIRDGRLVVNGFLSGSAVTVLDATLAGTGTVGALIAKSNSTIAPGNSIGTLKVAGNSRFSAGSEYQVQVNAEGQSDAIDAKGTTNLDGGLVKVFAAPGRYGDVEKYTIVTAKGGVTGVFDSVESDLAFFDPSLSYDPGHVFLTLTRNETDFHELFGTPNQIAAGTGVQSLDAGNLIYEAVLILSREETLRAFDAISGEVHASARGLMFDESRFVRDAALDRLRNQADDDASPFYTPWVRALGSWADLTGDGNAAGLRRSLTGFFGGIDGSALEDWRLGLIGGYTRSGIAIPERASTASVDSVHVGIYGGAQWKNFDIRSGFALSSHHVSADRTPAFAGFTDDLKSSYGAFVAQGFAEVGYTFSDGAFAVEPFAGVAHAYLADDGFEERGGIAVLSSDGNSGAATFGTLGLRASARIDLGGDARLTARGMVGWRHAFGDIPSSVLKFAGSVPFRILAQPLGPNALAVEAGLDLELTPSTSFGVAWYGLFGSRVSDQSALATLKVSF